MSPHPDPDEVAPGMVIRLLGPPSVEQAGHRRSPSGCKTWALLAFLLLTERPPSRTRLTDLFFPDALDPRAALRWSLADLRRLLGRQTYLTGDPVKLDLPAETAVDVTAVLRGAPHAWSIACLHGELLEGLTFASSAPLEHWLTWERHRLAAECAALLQAQAAHARRHGDLSHAAHLAGQLVVLDPFRYSDPDARHPPIPVPG